MSRERSAAALRRCERLVRRLDRTVGIPVPFELDRFLERWRAWRAGRPVTLLALPAAELPSGTCGMWLALPAEDVVAFPAGVPRNHRDHIVLHEIGHMLADHSGPVAGAGLAGLLPDLDPAMVRSMLGRSVYSAVEEQEAELIASLILQRSLATEPRSTGGPGAAAVVRRLEQTLDD